ncbi:Anaphase-promoting complex subunit 10 [Escovopsis weberi]|uniref:Anaphase-promoting complex subunit 10 n=1 Tax=Escovopsis weberi TaxID=150374 RepID=A0A0M9VWN3_ESCWE|nr:Anaphase-promoting complex subunit 10 [Escovopsis weberi]
MGLKEISNLGKFTVSTHKQGSDGPQPHKLTIYFVKRVGIRDIRFFVNYGDDESYTPTKIIFKSGTSENNLIEFASMTLESPVGWQQVPIAGAGGGPDGNTLVSYVLQMQIHENHQNGKDTHLRGIKIYAFDVDAVQGAAANPDTTRTEDAADISTAFGSGAVSRGTPSREARARNNVSRLDEISRALASTRLESGDGGLPVPDFMRDPEIR